MYYTIYKITNQVNGKIYMGSHKTKDLNDSYMGSGKYLKYAQEKYGIEHFTKEILYVFDTPELMYAKEAELVNEEFIAEANTYNLKVGGFGGWDYINTNDKLRIAKNKKARQIANQNGALDKAKQSKSILMNDPEYSKKVGKRISESLNEYYKHNQGPFANKKHTDETKSKIGLKNSKAQSGNGNSQYGTCWISHILIGSKKCKRELLPEYIDQGWIKGRNKFPVPVWDSNPAQTIA